MPVECDDCNGDIEKEDTVYVCTFCDKPICGDCKDEHCCLDPNEVDEGGCYNCGDTLGSTVYLCDECSEKMCSESCFENHFKIDHQDYEEMTGDEYMAQEVGKNL